jgi:hypothetical protein
MGEHGSASCTQRAYFKLMLFAGLLLSETQLLVNLKAFAPAYIVPYFTLTYFILSKTSTT